MTPIQILLLIALGAIALICLRLTRYRLGPLLLLSLVFVGGALAVWFPDATTAVANRLGVQRGADLLLYGTVIFLCGVCALIYGKFRKMDERYTLLIRELTLLREATEDDAE